MSNNIVQFNEEIIKGQIKELVRGNVEETLNELLEAEAEKLTQAARYERSEARQGYCSGRSPHRDAGVSVRRVEDITEALYRLYRRRRPPASGTKNRRINPRPPFPQRRLRRPALLPSRRHLQAHRRDCN